MSEKRREDPGLITGRTRFVDDIRIDPERPGMLHMLVVRSPYAHARIEQIETAAARTAHGVVAVITGKDLAGKVKPMAGVEIPGLKRVPRLPLAVDKTRYVGEPVAVILAESRVEAVDASDLLDMDYTPLPAVTDVEEAVRAEAPLLYEELGTNIAFTRSRRSGDVDKIFRQAEHITSLRLVNQRLAPASMENRGCLFDYDASSGEFYAWTSSQVVYRVKGVLAHYLDLPPERIHVRNAAVGGAFGAKTQFVGEELVAAWLALQHGRPVKWIEERSENLQAQAQGRGQLNYLQVAFQSDGTLSGFKIRTLADLGSFNNGIAVNFPVRTSDMLIGPYLVAAVESTVECIYTNKPPSTAYRGAGRPEATYILERTMDQIARELGLDPAEVRRRNFITPQLFPYQTVTGLHYDSGNYPALLTRLLQISEYQQWREEQRKRRTDGSTRRLGLGLATFTEVSGDEGAMPGSAREAALVRVQPDGSILVQSGVAHNGQGHYTLFAQITAEVFGMPVERVEVEMNNSDLPVYSIGTFGSRITQVGASVVLLAAEAARAKTLQMAAYILEAAPADLELAHGQVAVRGAPQRSIELGELARLVEEHPELLVGEEGESTSQPRPEGLAAWRDFTPDGAAWSSGAHLAIVEVDTETGDVEILQYFAVDDCGRVLNHVLAEAQLHGGLVQGIGQALFEEIVYNREGQPLSASLIDYALPLAKELPTFTTAFIETPSPTNPLGAKGVGESGTIGAPPAIVNAVLDALAPLDISQIDMPLKRERVWELLQQSKQG
ncbi:MAG TPA: xanthine dehydrogenase family protein molybdopterin-binding subunit [Ktedonobacteraceae bacterium]|nr:xanthine dehydrogenase family protein molybdopterin-binding subunit [Ktedonobacteraceae bacterium]